MFSYLFLSFNRFLLLLFFFVDGEFVAFSAHDSHVYIYSTSNMKSSMAGSKRGSNSGDRDALDCVAVCHKSSSPVTHLDWSQDIRNPNKLYIQTNDLSYEILRYELDVDNIRKRKKNSKPIKAQQITRRQDVQNLDWETYTNPLAWGVQGIWPSGIDGSDINAVDRSRNYEYVASADDFGDIKIFNYPCTNSGASYRVANGHSSHVMNVRFNSNSTVLYSVGGNDRSVFKWKLKAKK
jgi:WD40 repeat protein